MERERDVKPWRSLGASVVFCLVLAAVLAATAAAAEPPKPDVVLITVDTLRYDRLSANGYAKPTSPNLDALLAGGVGFDQMRVVEPLTAPSMVSMFTSLYPHDHGASRNGLRSRQRLGSLPKVLARNGYETVAFVGNWTLRDELCGLGEHFSEYHEVFNRKRWFGLFKGEATAEDLTEGALTWVRDHVGDEDRKPFLLWVHYVEPHAPYRLHEQFVAPLGIALREDVPAGDRYDTEVAFVDHSIGVLLARLRDLVPLKNTLVVFTSDHGESLGEHDYWGHGRHLYEMTLHVPMIFYWDSRLAPATIDALASNLDITPTVLGLLGLSSPKEFKGYDFSPVLLGTAEAPTGRTTFHQAHKGAAKGGSSARQNGLLEVGLVQGLKKETWRLKGKIRRVFDLTLDPRETESSVPRGSSATAALQEWLGKVREGLVAADELPATLLDEEQLEKLKALGYVD